ncbi:MAG: alpha-ketoglutarate-dependent dioxygenase AlkB family protein [Stackebrandtia sp.]
MNSTSPKTRAQIAPGATHVAGWLSPARQRELVAACREWSLPPAGMRTVRMPSGATMSARQVSLGWHWTPYRYSRTADDGTPVKPFPSLLGELARRAVAEVYGAAVPDYDPDVALVNFYDAAARMGMHQDKDEKSRAPVVSLSLGDACVFRFGNADGRGKPYVDVRLASGDLFVFGGPSRLAYHGVPKTFPGAGPGDIGLPSGRLNVTVRVTGLD